MRIILFIAIWCITGTAAFPQGEEAMLRTIQQADEKLPMDELARIVNLCTACCNSSSQVSVSLTKWLREDHPIYKGKSATDVDRFRGFLLYSLSKFPPIKSCMDT